MNNALKGKKIIFFCPKFFGYEVAIQQELENRGAQVCFRSAQAIEHAWVKGLQRLSPTLGWSFSDKKYNEWLDTESPDHCDIIFIVKGEALSPKFIKSLRGKYPDAKVILYMFDSIKNYKKMETKFCFIDEIFSFDPTDSTELEFIRYRPLFFLDKYLSKEKSHTGKNLFFVGTLNGDRPTVVSRLAETLPSEINFDYWLFVRSRLEIRLRKMFDSSLNKLETSRLIDMPMSHETISEHYINCCAVLDIEHPNQTGLTMRTFEVLASGKRLITTNKSIAHHDFYDPTRICIIDRNNPYVPADFFNSLLEPLPESFISRYSLSGWLSDIFSIKV